MHPVGYYDALILFSLPLTPPSLSCLLQVPTEEPERQDGENVASWTPSTVASR